MSQTQEVRLALEMREVSKRFPGTLAVDRVSLEVRAGEVHALVGENGAGKSTLMKMLAGSFDDYSGQIAINGEVVPLHSPALAKRHGVGMIYQELSLAKPISIAENLLVGRLPTKGGFLDRARLRSETRHWLGEVGLDRKAIVAAQIFDDHRAPAPYEVRTYHLTGLELPNTQVRLTMAQEYNRRRVQAMYGWQVAVPVPFDGIGMDGEAAARLREAAAQVADAQAAQKRDALRLTEIGPRKEDIAAAEARLAAAEAQLAQAETALADTRLAAPLDGVISARVRETGSMVSNASPIYTLSIQEPIYVRAYVSQTQLTHVRPGSAVTVYADGTPETFKGTIGFISPKAEFTPKSVETTELRTDLVYRVRVVLPGAARALRQGMPVTVEVDASAATPQ